MRLQRPIYAKKPVASIRLKILARDVPDSASVDITDVQLQAGEQATGVVPNPREAGTTIGFERFCNGVVSNRMELIVFSNTDAATPTRLDVRNASGPVRIGSYRFGDVQGDAHVDGANLTATHGWGRAPIITERSDLHLQADVTGRAHIRLGWKERR